MAVHILGSQDYRKLDYSEDLYPGIPRINNLVHNFYPAVSRVTSKSENKAFAWLFGKVKVEGAGFVTVIYPYEESSSDVLEFRNVSFSQYPYLLLVAQEHEGYKFTGWKNIVSGKLLSSDRHLVLSKYNYTDVTGFLADFEENEDDLGI